MKIKLLLFAVFTSLSIFTQNQTIDLKVHLNEVFQKTVSSGNLFKVVVINKAPGKTYSVLIQRKTIPQTSFDLSVFNTTELANAVPTDSNNAKELIWFDKLEKGEQLEIVITHTNEAGIESKWTTIYSTKKRGVWQASYGFSFITQAFNKEQLFLTSEVASGYEIKKQNNRKTLDFAPSIFFTWMPSKYNNENLSFGFSGGLGFDFENPTVFLSPTLSYNENIKLHVGIVAHRQNVLYGIYEEGQVVGADFDLASQLHETLYRINPFISLSFRFGQNPFSLKN